MPETSDIFFTLNIQATSKSYHFPTWLILPAFPSTTRLRIPRPSWPAQRKVWASHLFSLPLTLQTHSLLSAGQLGSQSLAIQILSLRSCKPSDTYSLHLAQGDLALATSLTGFSTSLLLNFSVLDTLTLLILKNANHTFTSRPKQFYLKYFRGSSITSLYILFLEPFPEYAN